MVEERKPSGKILVDSKRYIVKRSPLGLVLPIPELKPSYIVYCKQMTISIFKITQINTMVTRSDWMTYRTLPLDAEPHPWQFLARISVGLGTKLPTQPSFFHVMSASSTS